MMDDAIIFMKYGFHVRDVPAILATKRKNLAECGRLFWGYNGTHCNPITQVQPFAREAVARHGRVPMLLSYTPSKPRATGWQAKEFSEDQVHWQPLPAGIHVEGSEVAIVCDSLEEVSETLMLHEYEVAVGRSQGTLLSDFIRYQVSKACALRTSRPAPAEQVPTPIGLRFNVVEPFAVFLR